MTAFIKIYNIIYIYNIRGKPVVTSKHFSGNVSIRRVRQKLPHIFYSRTCSSYLIMDASKGLIKRYIYIYLYSFIYLFIYLFSYLFIIIYFIHLMVINIKWLDVGNTFNNLLAKSSPKYFAWLLLNSYVFPVILIK